MTTATTTETAIEVLTNYIKEEGPIQAARVSSAQCGSACPWAYWGAVRYEIRLRKDGIPTAAPLERAGRDRRSMAGAERDMEALCERENRVPFYGLPGPLREWEAAEILERLKW